jgi:ankyrin repeat protein
MLENTPAKDKKDAVRLLQFLVHSKIPLVVPEAVEIIATRIDRESQRFDIGNRFFSEADILHCCPGMISIVEVHEYNGTTRKELHLAHFSVKEYLLTLTDFNLETSSVTITMTCLTYLTEIEGELSTLAYKFPLAKYAAEWWMDFGRIAEKSKHIVHMAVGFMQHDATYRRWHHLFNPDMIWGFGKPYPVGSELYYACAAGLVEITAALIANGSDVNAPGGYYGNALQASSHKSYLNIVRLLLEKGADVNLRGGRYGSALQAACSKQDLAIVELLLDKGADITIAGKYGSILQAACYGGSEEIIKLLLGKGIDVNIQGGKYGNALQAASRRGRLEVVNILLRNGADVNANGGDYGTALQAASWKGNLEVVNLLLDKGANVNMQGGDYGNALQAASWAGSIEVIQLLLDRGADITATSSGGWTPVNRAAYSGHLEAVKLLIEKGDDITPDNNSGNTPISYAANYENLALLQLLLSTPGTNINQTDNFGLSPLFKASRYGRSKVVQYLLLGTHADPSIRTWCGTTALFAAVANGHARTVEFLIPHYSSLEKHGGFGKSLVWWARRAGRPQITELLLKHGGKSLNLLDEEFSPEDYDALPFDPCDDWCLACTVCIAEASQYSCEECDGFLVCGDCVSKGIRCPDFTHPRPSKARPRGGLRVRKDRADMMTGEE